MLQRIYDLDKRIVNLLVFLTCCIGTGVWAIVLGQDINWDLKNYHFYNPYAFLNNKLTYDYAPAMLQSYYNPLLDLPSYWLIINFPPIVAGFVIGFVQGLNVFILYLIANYITSTCSPVYKILLILAICILGFYSVANLCEIGTTFGDNLISLFILFPVFILTRDYFRNDTLGIKPRALLYAGAIMGIGTGMKLTIAIYPIAIGIAIFWLFPDIRKYLHGLFLLGLATFTGFVCCLGYWAFTMWQHFKNPFFPYFNGIFKSPYFAPENFSDKRFLPDDIWQSLFYPFYFLDWQRHTSELLFKDMHFAVCYVLLIFFIIYILYKRFISKQRTAGHTLLPFTFFLLTLGIVSYVLWQNLFSIYRYTVILEFLSPLFIFLILYSFIKNQKALTASFLAITTLTVLHVGRMDFGRLAWTDSYFGVELPEVPDLENANIVMGSFEPLGYMVPSFPSTTRFLRVDGNFPSLTDTTGFQKEIQQHLNTSTKNYLLTSYWEKERVIQFENKFSFNVDSSDCTYFKTRLDTSLCMCGLEKRL